MTTRHQLLTDTLDYLQTLARDGIRPEQALAQFRHLQRQYPETRMDLLWEEEGYDLSVHYDTLLHVDGAGTISLSFCPDRGLPWPLRGVQRATERTLLRVNTIQMEIDQAIAVLDFIWDDARLVDRLVKAALLQEIFNQEEIELSHAELQAAMDAFRRAKKLYTAEDTHRWMQRNSLTHDTLETLVKSKAMLAKLRDRVTAGGVESYFDSHRADFDTARIARFSLRDAAQVHAVYAQIQAGERDFYAAAQAAFESQAMAAAELFVTVQRSTLSPELADAIFAAAPGDVVGPMATEAGSTIVRVLSSEVARLDEPTRRAIKEILFDAWLTERRESATVEWYWGNASRTTATA